MNTNTLKMTEMMEDSTVAEPMAFLLAVKAHLARLMGTIGVAVTFVAITLWMNQPFRVEFASWLVPAEAYEIFESSFDQAVPSIASQAAKIPTNLVDDQAIDRSVLRTYSERQAVAKYLATKYKIGNSASLEFVDKAMTVSREVGLDPTLILAVTAVESGFNPNAESKRGAQGLMQVMTLVHAEKYQLFGGHGAALNPDANMRVGSLILREYIAKGGSLQAGLRLYVGASSQLIDDGGYGDKVLAERQRLKEAAGSKFAFSNNPKTL
jgi:hypothetical protein